MASPPLVRAGAARRTARRWVRDVAATLPGFQGAFLHGSILEMADDAPFPATSDVDVGLVLSDAEAGALGAEKPHPALGKTRYAGLLIEGAPIAAARLSEPDQVLGDYRLAPSFRADGILADPTGGLRRLQREVGPRFAERRWVRARAEDARRNCLRYVGLLDAAPSGPVQAICWLFAEGNLAHVVLAAGLRNPTVRRRYAAARALLASARRLDVYEHLLAMLGAAHLAPDRVGEHLCRMTEAFDAAASAIRSSFPFRSDLSEVARPLAVEGSRGLLESGQHREAIFWIAVTYARCMEVLEADAPPSRVREHGAGFRALLGDLGVESFEAMRRRADEIDAFLPELMQLAWDLAPRTG